MSTTTNTNATKSTTRPATLSKSEWERLTYGAYIGLIRLVEDKVTEDKFLNYNKPLFNACGIEANRHNLLHMVWYMVTDTTKEGEKVTKVKCLASLRKWFNTECHTERKVVYTEPKKPTQPKAKTTKTAKTSKTHKTADIKEMLGQLPTDELKGMLKDILGNLAA